MKFKLLFIGLIITQMGIGQTANVKLSGSIFGAPTDTLFVSQMYDNNRVKNFDTIVTDKEGNFSTELTLPREDYYLLRVGNANVHLVCRNLSDIKIYGDDNFVKMLIQKESMIFLMWLSTEHKWKLI
jgi:hypothetical protein